MKNLILIGMPVHGNIFPQTVADLIALSGAIEYPAKIHFQSNCYVHDARNKIAREALAIGAEYLMFIDADMSFPPDGVNRLVADDKDIVGGVYYRRQKPHLPTFSVLDGKKMVIPDQFPKDELFEVFGLATGFMLIKTKVFKKIKPPWFYFGNFHGKPMGEDTYFCWKAKKAGFEVWADPTIPLGHIGEYLYDAQDYQAYKENKTVEIEFTGEL